jgi:hypothetical protein
MSIPNTVRGGDREYEEHAIVHDRRCMRDWSADRNRDV